MLNNLIACIGTICAFACFAFRKIVFRIASFIFKHKWDDPAYRADSHPTGEWDRGRDEPDHFNSDLPIEAAPVDDRSKLYEEWEFSFLPSEEIEKAFHRASYLIKKCIYDYGRLHHFEVCDPLWDAICDVNLERGNLWSLFGREGQVTKDMNHTMIARFSYAIDRLYEFRNNFAHNSNDNRGGVSLQVNLDRISLPKILAELLEDHSTVQQLDALIEGLQNQARTVQENIEERWATQGLDNPALGWPRHCERLFHCVMFATPEQREKVPPIVVEAALNWSTVYDSPGIMIPNYAAQAHVQPANAADGEEGESSMGEPESSSA